jgi:hypothetical protein
MGTYKVPQNVEAEDKILGPLTLKQFIYAIIGAAWGLVSFAIFKSVPILFVIIGLPPTIFLLALGLYQREDQPFEVFFVSVLQYLFRSRSRLWIKEPIAEVFHVEPPKPKALDVRRNPREVRGQLETLGEVVDSRGWASKHPALQEPGEEQILDLSDRIGAERIEVPQMASLEDDVAISEADDVLDVASPRAAELSTLIEDTEKNLRQEAVSKMQQAQNLKPKKQPAQNLTPIPAASAVSSGNPQNANAIIKLAAEGGDLTVAQIANQAKRTTTPGPSAGVGSSA